MPITRAFCTFDALSEIIRHRNEPPYNSAYCVLEKLCNIFIIDDVDINAEAIKNPIIKKLRNRSFRHFKTHIKLEENLKNPRTDDIFLLLSPDFDKYRDCNKDKGVLIINSKSELGLLENLTLRGFRPFSLLTKEQKQALKEHNEEFEDLSSWKDVFEIFKVSPINSAVIIDNYLFHGRNFGRRFNSLYAILRNIVPKDLKVPFHLTIFVENNSNELTPEKMKDVVYEIHDLHLCDKMLVSIVAHVVKDKTHDRVILTNFHYITSGKGFSMVDRYGVKENAKGEIVATFKDILYLNTSQLTMKHLHSQMIDWMKDIYIDDKGADSESVFEVGDNFNNRLLDDYES